MRRFFALAALLAGLFGAAFVLASAASAHATVVGTDPVDGSRLQKAPSEVTFTFDEPVGLSGIGYLHVTNQQGQRVDVGNAFHPNGDGTKVTDKLKSGLGDGSYLASYRVISADSHPVAGSIAFVVGHGQLITTGTGSTSATNGTTSTVFDIARWVSYGGIALLGGAWLVLTVWPEGRRDRRSRQLVWTGWTGAVIGGVAELLIQGAYTAGDGPAHAFDWSLLKDTLHTDYGQYHCGRLWLLGLLAVILALAMRDDSEPERWEIAAVPLGLAVLWTYSAGGHASTTNPTWLSIPFDMLHLTAMAVWLGGLVMLAVAILPRRDAGELTRVLPVFSKAAFASVVVLAGTGTWAAWWGIGSIDAIWDTTYGLLVLGKIVLFFGLLALGNLSRSMVQRRVGMPVAYAATDAVLAAPAPPRTRTGSDDDLIVERLRRSVGVEVVVGIVVLVLTAVLVAEPRGNEALAIQYQQPISGSASLGGGRSVEITSSSGTHGDVDLTVAVTGGALPKSIAVQATQTQQEIGPLPVTVKRSGSTWSGTVDLPVSGEWQFALAVTTSRFDATTTDITLDYH